MASDIPIELRPYAQRRRYAMKLAAEADDINNWRAYMPRPSKQRPAAGPSVQEHAAAGRSRRIRRMDEAIRIGLARRAGITPLEFLLSCLRDPQVRFAFKLDAAKAAAPYMHKRMPISVQAQGPEGTISLHAAALHRLTPEELNTLCVLLVKAGVGEPEFIGPEPATFRANSTTHPDGAPTTEPFAGRTTEPFAGRTTEPFASMKQISGPRTYESTVTCEKFENPNAGGDAETLDVINNEEALRAAYEAGAISHDTRPLEMPSDRAPDLTQLMDGDPDDGIDPDFEHIPEAPSASAQSKKGFEPAAKPIRVIAERNVAIAGGRAKKVRVRNRRGTAAAGRAPTAGRDAANGGDQPEAEQKRQPKRSKRVVRQG